MSFQQTRKFQSISNELLLVPSSIYINQPIYLIDRGERPINSSPRRKVQIKLEYCKEIIATLRQWLQRCGGRRGRRGRSVTSIVRAIYKLLSLQLQPNDSILLMIVPLTGQQRGNLTTLNNFKITKNMPKCPFIKRL